MRATSPNRQPERVRRRQTMKREDVHFHILRRLEKKPDMTQRELAEEPGISVSRVDYCVQALMEKGLVKARNSRNSRNKRAYLYKLTPSGISEKAAMTVRFIQRKEQERQALLREIEDLRAEVGEAEQTPQFDES